MCIHLYPMTEKFKCPVCDGKGHITTVYARGKEMDKKEKQAKKLRQAGLSIREIMRVMGYSSPHSITKLLEK